jgi:hypothetical protein
LRVFAGAKRFLVLCVSRFISRPAPASGRGRFAKKREKTARKFIGGFEHGG